MIRRRNDCENNGDDSKHEDASFGETQFAKRARNAFEVLSEKTSIPLRIIIPISALLLVTTYRVTTAIALLQNRIDQTWSVSDQEKWSRQFRKDNPTIIIPDSREIFDENVSRRVKLIP